VSAALWEGGCYSAVATISDWGTSEKSPTLFCADRERASWSYAYSWRSTVSRSSIGGALAAREIDLNDESKRVLEGALRPNSRLLHYIHVDGRHETVDSEAMEPELRGGILFVPS
jgi:hypothetical protein